MPYTSLHDRLRGPIANDLKKELKIKNTHALPGIEKVVVNVGINKTKMDSKEMHGYVADSLAKITGQKPVFTKARQAISNFKTREGIVVGVMVTLRGKQMEEFLDRLISYALPRIRDFRGVTTKLDGHGNYSIGIRDHSIFPEVPLPDAKQIFGIQVQITTSTDNDDEAKALLKAMGMPFKKEVKEEKGEKEEKEKLEAMKAMETIEAIEEETNGTSASAPSERSGRAGKATADKKETKDSESSEIPNDSSSDPKTPNP